MSKTNSFTDKCFKDKDGRVILIQRPNLPLIVWFIGLMASKLVSIGIVHDLASIISFGAIFTWAWLELFQGVNYFRRVLGLVVMTFVILGKLQ